ncbi:MAG: peptidylprolyl isomerase [Flavobacteriales bacterium]|nr:peptidylprolyl isomerase [Flavobacteriales bacterium]
MNIPITSKGTYIILTILSVSLLLSCAGPQPNKKQESEITTAKPKSEVQQEVTVQKKTPRPREGKVKQFFEDYGAAHPETFVLLKTRLGNIKVRLYEQTPIHRANFLYNVTEELYHHTIFYRVVPEFMIQGGNSDHYQTLEKREEAGAYYIPNETTPELIHKRGAMAMAMSYKDNPKQKSAQYSYYIVIGKPLSEDGLDAVEEEYSIRIPPSAREVYKNIGGSPHLDGVHTVFGEVVEGMDVVEAISNEKRDSGDWPINDVIIDHKVLE